MPKPGARPGGKGLQYHKKSFDFHMNDSKIKQSDWDEIFGKKEELGQDAPATADPSPEG